MRAPPALPSCSAAPAAAHSGTPRQRRRLRPAQQPICRPPCSTRLRQLGRLFWHPAQRRWKPLRAALRCPQPAESGPAAAPAPQPAWAAHAPAPWTDAVPDLAPWAASPVPEPTLAHAPWTDPATAPTPQPDLAPVPSMGHAPGWPSSAPSPWVTYPRITAPPAAARIARPGTPGLCRAQPPAPAPAPDMWVSALPESAPWLAPRSRSRRRVPDLAPAPGPWPTPGPGASPAQAPGAWISMPPAPWVAPQPAARASQSGARSPAHHIRLDAGNCATPGTPQRLFLAPWPAPRLIVPVLLQGLIPVACAWPPTGRPFLPHPPLAGAWQPSSPDQTDDKHTCLVSCWPDVLHGHATAMLKANGVVASMQAAGARSWRSTRGTRWPCWQQSSGRR